MRLRLHVIEVQESGYGVVPECSSVVQREDKEATIWYLPDECFGEMAGHLEVGDVLRGYMDENDNLEIIGYY